MNELIQFPAAIVDEPVYLIPDSAKLTISPLNANLIPTYPLNKNGTVIFYTAPKGGNISAEGVTAINKLILAVKLKPEETFCTEVLPDMDFRFNKLIKDYPVTQLICFGIEPENLGLHLDLIKYKAFKFNKIDMIFCDSMEGMALQKRTLLWNQLKLMYNIS